MSDTGVEMEMEMLLGDRLHRPRDLAPAFKVSEKTVLRLIASGELRAIRVGARWRVPTSEVRRFLEANRSEA